MTIRTLPYPLAFSPNDLLSRDIEELASHMRVSLSFVRLCIAAGCPLTSVKLSAGRLLVWLFDHYEDVRSVAGLKPLASVDGLAPDVTARLRMADALVTLLEFGRARATQWKQKRALRRALEQVSLLCDHGA